MRNFEVQTWHVVTLIVSLLVGIFKNDIVRFYQGILFVWQKPFAVGQTVEVLNPSGTWDAVEIVHYNLAIPFVKNGGIVVKHLDAEGAIHMEELSYANWAAQRIRDRKDPGSPVA